jgi:hypothetical protein
LIFLLLLRLHIFLSWEIEFHRWKNVFCLMFHFCLKKSHACSHYNLVDFFSIHLLEEYFYLCFLSFEASFCMDIDIWHLFPWDHHNFIEKESGWWSLELFIIPNDSTNREVACVLPVTYYFSGWATPLYRDIWNLVLEKSQQLILLFSMTLKYPFFYRSYHHHGQKALQVKIKKTKVISPLIQ